MIADITASANTTIIIKRRNSAEMLYIIQDITWQTVFWYEFKYQLEITKR